jgi:hypothetical protein
LAANVDLWADLHKNNEIHAGFRYEAAEQYFKENGIRIELVDVEQFAKLIVEHGIRTKLT